MYGAHAACQHAPGVRCHFLSHFDCGEEEDLEEADFEAHPRDVIPQGFVGRGSFWWYAHVTHFLLQVRCAFDLLRLVSTANPYRQPPTADHQPHPHQQLASAGSCCFTRHLHARLQVVPIGRPASGRASRDSPDFAFVQENSDFRLKLSAAKAALGFQRPIIGVHVR